MNKVTEDHEARQLALIREQRPIVAALRAAGCDIDFLFAPRTETLPHPAKSVLEHYLESGLSLETRLIIADLLQIVEEPARSSFSATAESRETTKR